MDSIALRRLVAAAVIATAAGVAAWLLLIKDDDGGSPEVGRPVEASIAELRQVAASVGHPVYWAGAQPGLRYELTRTADGRVFIRYLGPGARIGDPRPGFLTVATYPMPNSLTVLRRLAGRPGNESLDLPGPGLAVSSRRQAKSAYLAFPGIDVQVEVFGPTPTVTRSLVSRGAISQIR